MGLFNRLFGQKQSPEAPPECISESLSPGSGGSSAARFTSLVPAWLTVVSRRHVMRDYHAFRHTAIRYWERRRIIYNLALVLPAIFGFGFADTLNWVGDPQQTHYACVLPLFAMSALGANICYSFAYALEFLLGRAEPTSRWMRYGRTTAFVGGLVLAMFLALIAGRSIAEMEWYHGIKHAG